MISFPSPKGDATKDEGQFESVAQQAQNMHQWLYRRDSGNQRQESVNQHTSMVNLVTEESVLNQTRDASRFKLIGSNVQEETKVNQEESILNGLLAPQKCVSPTY